MDIELARLPACVLPFALEINMLETEDTGAKRQNITVRFISASNGVRKKMTAAIVILKAYLSPRALKAARIIFLSVLSSSIIPKDSMTRRPPAEPAKEAAERINSGSLKLRKDNISIAAHVSKGTERRIRAAISLKPAPVPEFVHADVMA
jgi:hypothetical protein